MGLLRKAFSGFIWGQAGKIIEVIIGLTFTVAAGRILKPQGYGLYTFIMSFVGMGLVVSSLGFPETLGRFIPQLLIEGKTGSVAYAVRRLFRLRLLAGVLVGCLFILFRHYLAGMSGNAEFSKYFLFIGALIVLNGASDFFQSLYIATLRIRFITLVKLCAQAAVLAFALLLWNMFGPKVGVLLAVASAVSAALVLVFFLDSRKHAVRPDPVVFSLRPLYSFAAIVWLTGLAIFALATHIDKIFIGIMLKDPAQVGYYSIATIFVINIHGLLSSGWGITILPVLSEARAKHGDAGMAKVIRTYFKLYTFLLFPAVAFLAFNAGKVIAATFGPAYAPSAPLLSVYALFAMVSNCFMGGISVHACYACGKERVVLKTCLVAGLVNIVLDLSLIPVMGAMGAVIATGLSIILFTVLQMVFVVKSLPLRYPARFVAKIIAITCFSFVPFLWISLNNLAQVLTGALAYALVFILLASIVKVLEPEDKEILSGMGAPFSSVIKHL
jgi:O-antigen/teichoic acid export membrane protein